MLLRTCVEDLKRLLSNLGLKIQPRLLSLSLIVHVMEPNSITIADIQMIIQVEIQKVDALKSRYLSLLKCKSICMESRLAVTLTPCSKYSTPTTRRLPKRISKLADLVTLPRSSPCSSLNQLPFLSVSQRLPIPWVLWRIIRTSWSDSWLTNPS